MTTFIYDTWDEPWIDLTDRALLDPEVIAQLWRCINTKRTTMQDTVFVANTEAGLFTLASLGFPDGTDPADLLDNKGRQIGANNINKERYRAAGGLLSDFGNPIEINGIRYRWATGDEFSYTSVSVPPAMYQQATYYMSAVSWQTLITTIRNFLDSLDLLVSVSLDLNKVQKSQFFPNPIGALSEYEFTKYNAVISGRRYYYKLENLPSGYTIYGYQSVAAAEKMQALATANPSIEGFILASGEKKYYDFRTRPVTIGATIARGSITGDVPNSYYWPYNTTPTSVYSYQNIGEILSDYVLNTTIRRLFQLPIPWANFVYVGAEITSAEWVPYTKKCMVPNNPDYRDHTSQPDEDETTVVEQGAILQNTYYDYGFYTLDPDTHSVTASCISYSGFVVGDVTTGGFEYESFPHGYSWGGAINGTIGAYDSFTGLTAFSLDVTLPASDTFWNPPTGPVGEVKPLNYISLENYSAIDGGINEYGKPITIYAYADCSDMQTKTVTEYASLGGSYSMTAVTAKLGNTSITFRFRIVVP